MSETARRTNYLFHFTLLHCSSKFLLALAGELRGAVAALAVALWMMMWSAQNAFTNILSNDVEMMGRRWIYSLLLRRSTNLLRTKESPVCYFPDTAFASAMICGTQLGAFHRIRRSADT